MRPQKHKIVSVSDKRWKAAQNGERRHHASTFVKQAEPPTETRFFSQNFLLGSEFFNGKGILEVGCTPQATIHSLIQARFRVGIDPLTEEWRDFYPSNTVHLRGRAEQLPFEDGTFDVVLCLNVLDQVQSPIDSLREIQRCLKRGGKLLLWVQTFCTVRMVRRRLTLTPIDPSHPHHFSDSEVYRVLQELGYKIDYHQCRRASFSSALSVIRRGRFVSGVKSLAANLFLGLHESSYTCSKTT